MILIGQYDSPFVRRVGIALTLYKMEFEHRTWSAFGDAERLRAYNPLTRVPALVLVSGETLVDSHCMLDYLDALVPPEAALFPRAEPERYRALRVASLACGLADKAVALFYELRLHTQVSSIWETRCRTQIASVLAALETERAARTSAFWFGPRAGHADIAIACALRFISEAHPGLLDRSACPALAAHSAALEATPAFGKIYQAFVPPE